MVDSALIEPWALYAGGSLIIALRIFARTRIVGVRNYKPDDYLIVPAWIAYTVMTVAAHMVSKLGDTSFLTEEERRSATPEQVQNYTLGSKWFMVGQYTYPFVIWSLKLNMLWLYQRVLTGLWPEKFVKPTMGLVLVTLVAIYILLSTLCRPFHKLWQVQPDPGPYCRPQNVVFLTTTLAFNLVTDIIIFLLPIPVILPIQTSLARRIGLYILFSLGIFIMIAAILRVVFILRFEQGQIVAAWSCREDFVAILVGQATMLRQLFTQKFWRGGYRNTDQEYQSSAVKLSSMRNTSKGNSKSKDPYRITALDADDSTEEIVKGDNTSDSTHQASNVISVESSYKVEVVPHSSIETQPTTFPHERRSWMAPRN